MLVVPRDGDATMVIPRLEAPASSSSRACSRCCRGTRPTTRSAIVAELAAGATTAAVGDQMWARFLVELLPQLPGTRLPPGRRRRRSAADGQGRRRDRRAAGRRRRRRPGRRASCTAGEIPLVGRTEAQVSADISARLIAEGHDKVNFAIVAAGENAASPHHHAGDRVIGAGEIVLCDFGGTMAGYCSDTTRCVFTGQPCRPRSPRPTPCCTRPRQASVASADGRHAVRGRRPGGPASHRRRRLRRVLHPPHRPRHRAWRSTRTRTSSRATHRPLDGRPRLQRRAGHLRRRAVGDAPRGHRRRHRRRPGPAERADHGLVASTAAQPALRANWASSGVGGERRQLDDHVGGVDAGQRAAVERAVGQVVSGTGSPRTSPAHRRWPRSNRPWRRCGRRRRAAGGPLRSIRRSRAPAGCR